MHARRDVCTAFSIFAGINVIFDESLGISTELRTAYAFFVILSLVAAIISFAVRIIAAHNMRQVRGLPTRGTKQLERLCNRRFKVRPTLCT